MSVIRNDDDGISFCNRCGYSIEDFIVREYKYNIKIILCQDCALKELHELDLDIRELMN